MDGSLSRDFYATSIGSLRKDLSNRKNLEKKVEQLKEQRLKCQKLFLQMVNAQKLLSTVSDDNTDQTLSFITGMVNKTLAEVFPGDVRRIHLRKKLFAGSKPHIIVELRNSDDDVMDMVLQNGAGLRQVVSFMYSLCLIEIRKGRRLFLSDECLNGLHREAKNIISKIIEIFSEGGFQFIFVEYELNNIGKFYNVEKRGNESTIVSLDGVEYDSSMIYINDVDLSVLDENYVENEEEELIEEKVID